MKKKIKAFFKWLFIVLAAVLILMTSWNQIMCAIDRSKAKDKFSADYVTVDGKKMQVTILGEENDTTIVFLPGLGGVYSEIEYKSFNAELAKDYKVVVLEPFGYGLSDDADTDRVIDNIVEELHAGVKALGIDEYYLMAHSWGGVYSLLWANEYPDEVKGFIGIDPSVPGQENLKMGPFKVQTVNKALTVFMKAGSFIGIDRIKSIISGDSDEVRYPYTQEEMELYDYLYLNRFMNSNILSETFLIDRSFEIISGMTFPDSVPVLNLVSSQNGEQMPGWIELHEAVQGNNPNTTMVIIEGSHGLTSDNPEALLEEIHNWIK
ncbi:MAG: alpha/beta hydrolase [Saccharofermentans sp.]|nr:alpha/beta hydrolase [Saccharofermentans sp.]